MDASPLQDAHSHREKFCSSQQLRLDALACFAKEARLRRQQVTYLLYS